VRAELVFSGFVDPATNLLTTNDKPFNALARLAAGITTQPEMDAEQAALGPYRERFLVCCNEPEMDLHWDSGDPFHVKKASMSKRHRIITTRTIHWQWFNALIFGLVPEEVGGATMREALEEVQALREAALLYAKTIGGWSDNVGLFVNVFGHNNVNVLCVHVLDMSELGPGFQVNIYKNCPLDAVLRVLTEDALAEASGVVRYPPVLAEPPLALAARGAPRRSNTADGLPVMFFTGTEGATSLKDELAARVPVLRDASRFREVRRVLLQELGGIASLHEELRRFNFIEHDTHHLSTGTAPMNLFARIVAGKIKQPLVESEQEWLGAWKERYQICCNMPDNDANWDSDDPDWVGRASMSMRHRFITTKNLHWQWFNALSFGLVPPEDGGVSLEDAIAELQDMKAAALFYASNAHGWSSNVGLFFHVFGHNSVNSLHLHVLDMDHVGPTFKKLNYKNCPLDAVLKVLEEERRSQVLRTLEEEGCSSAASSVSPGGEGLPSQHSQPFVSRSRSSSIGGEMLELIVRGETIVVSVETLMIAPDGSRLKDMLASSSSVEPPERDERGSGLVQPGGFRGPGKRHSGPIHVDAPPRSFRIILDHLGLVQSTSSRKVVQALIIPEELRSDLENLARYLGVAFILEQPLYGRASATIT